LNPPFEIFAIHDADQTEKLNRPSNQLNEINIHQHSRRLILTSGTTGKQKLVSLSSDQIKTHLEEAAQQVGEVFNNKTVLLYLMGVDTIGGFIVPLVTWIKGGAVLMLSNSVDINETIKNQIFECNILCAPPARLKLLLDNIPGVWPARENRKIRTVGSRMHVSLRDALLSNMGSSVQLSYGSTETGGISSGNAMVIDQDPATAGKVFHNVSVEIVDQNGRVLPYGHLGLVRCKTKAMAHGYADDEVSLHFKDGWFYPGDVGRITEEGWLSITGRNSDVINLGGLKLSAVEIESRLLDIKELQDVCVVSVNILGADELTVAVVYDSDINLSKVREKIDTLMPENMSCHVVRVPFLPRNKMGKLLRNQLSQKLTELISKK
jgi:acyl-coenzyme A synthetase/AMP-(fatty) acid ligase